MEVVFASVALVAPAKVGVLSPQVFVRDTLLDLVRVLGTLLPAFIDLAPSGSYLHPLQLDHLTEESGLVPLRKLEPFQKQFLVVRRPLYYIFKHLRLIESKVVLIQTAL